MSFGPAFDAKEQVRQAIDIVDLVGSYVQLRRNGRNFVGICPWHDDSRPSLQVNPDRQSFKCWVCDYGGDVFSFVMRSENMEFREALEFLAERAGIELKRQPQFASEFEGGTPRPEDDKRTLYRVLAWAEDQFHRCLLHGPEGEPGRAYFAERGISQEMIEKFHLGYAPVVQRWDWLLDRMRNSEWSPGLLERVGLLRRKELGGGHYDWFRGRAMFSIRDARSRPIAFGGRVLPELADEKSAKYINSPETPLFSKSRELYALDVARDHFKNDGGAIVMEGYTDVLMAQQHGITNCVAVLGTALGERHLQLLRRYTETITLVLDGDAAGRRRTNEILDALLALFEKNSVDLRILTLPEGIDPCDFIATHGSDSFRALLAHAVDALEHKFRSVTNGLDTLNDTHRSSQAAEQLLATLAQIRPQASGASSQTLLREEQMLSRISRQFHLPEEKLRSRLIAIRQEARGRRTSPYSAEEREANGESLDSRSNIPNNISELPTWDRSLLELVILDPSYLARVADVIDPASISSPVARRIFTGLCRLAEQGMHEDFGRLLAAYDEPEMKNLLVQLDESAANKTKADRERWLADLFDSHNRRGEEQSRRATLAAARQSDDEDAMRLLAQSLEQNRTKHLSEYERRKK
ncbi:MAG TPA: DNA primase [Lacipirellulaceae bacterium]|nr:DNA primase [Lacipirellulaceae bacterium]